jgi:hypothetical protein
MPRRTDQGRDVACLEELRGAGIMDASKSCAGPGNVDASVGGDLLSGSRVLGKSRVGGGNRARREGKGTFPIHSWVPESLCRPGRRGRDTGSSSRQNTGAQAGGEASGGQVGWERRPRRLAEGAAQGSSDRRPRRLYHKKREAEVRARCAGDSRVRQSAPLEYCANRDPPAAARRVTPKFPRYGNAWSG